MKREPLDFFGEKPIFSPLVASQAKQIVSADARPGGGTNWRFRCATAGCGGSYDIQTLRKKKKHCEPCRRKERTMFGVSFVSPLVQAHKHRIKAIERVGQGNIYTVECATDGCSHVYRVNKLNHLENKKCIWCWRRGRRMRPKWFAHYRKLAKTARDIGKALTISFEQFTALCEIPNCFYCRAVLDRQPYTEPGKKKNMAYRLDRMYPDGDYTLANVVTCCWSCNNAKRNCFSAREFLVTAMMRGHRPDLAQVMVMASDDQLREAASRWHAASAPSPS